MLTRFETFIHNLTEIDLYWHRVASAQMSAYGLKGNWAIYFTQLYHHPDGLTNVQLQKLCSKDKSDVSKDIKALEEHGYVQKNGEAGKYKQSVVLTESGKRLTEEIVKKAESIVSVIGKDLTEEERTVFYKSFNIIAQNLKEFSDTNM